MTPDPEEVVTVYSGPPLVVEGCREALAEAGIESKMTGDGVMAGFGSALPGAVELYVHRRDFDRAVAAIQRYEGERTGDLEKEPAPAHPTDDAKPEGAQHRVKHHIPQHPTGQ